MTFRSFFMAAIFGATSALSAWAQPNTDLRPSETVFLYSRDAENMIDAVIGQKITFAGFDMADANSLSGPETLQLPMGLLGNVSDYARVDLYFPAQPAERMVVVCPGGGYAYLSSFNEGVYVAEWLIENGFAVAVVKYRMPNGHWEVPLEDVQNAFRYCRAHAQEWNVRTVGIMGFSAGGHLAATASTMFTDEVTRPDFSVLIYPVITMEKGITHKGTRNKLIGTDEAWEAREGAEASRHEELLRRYSLDNQVTANTPPTFLALSTDDTTVPPENSLRYYKALIKNGVDAQMYIYPSGKHGWGFTTLRYAKTDKLGDAREEFNVSLLRFLSGR